MNDGKSVETSMGLTALDGLVMGTRCGSIDPGAVLYLIQSRGMSADDVTHLLYNQSGLLGMSGNLYGTTLFGGGSGSGCFGSGCGVVFKLSPSGTETVLHSFAGSDGALPFAGLIADRLGNLYGTTLNGGASNGGVVFELSGTGFKP